MKKQFIAALCAVLMLSLILTSCTSKMATTTSAPITSLSALEATPAAPRSVLAECNPTVQYAIDPPLELYDNSDVSVMPDYFTRFEYVGKNAIEVIAMLNIVNALTAEQISEPEKKATDPKSNNEWYYDWFIIEFTHNNILFMISAGVQTDGTATFGLLEHDLTTDKQTQRYSFCFQNDEWESLIESIRAQISQ